tara:strand:+ start:1466 stop:2611 length:1146 start_codon:yes stop_codon:yes gene_type:complete
MPINFPTGPSTNDTYNLGTRTWKWNGEAWELQPLTGGFTGSQGAIGYTGSAGSAPTDSLTLVNTSVDDTISATTTEDSSSAGPVITLKRNSSSPADADYLGQLKFKGENDADQEIVYAKITAKIQDASDGTEDGILEFANKKAGSNVITARLKSDKLQLLNSTSLEVDGSLTVGGQAITPVTAPTISSISPTAIVTSTATAVTITGTNFVSIPQVEALNPSTGIWYTADSVTFTSSTVIVATFTIGVNASYKLRIENPDGNAVLSSSALMSVSAAPTFSTSAGSLGSFAGNFSGTIATLAGSSDSAITFSETTNVLTNASQANCSLNSSSGAITTTDLGGSATSPTTYNFTIRITDAESQTVDRAFSITTTYGATGGAQFN